MQGKKVVRAARKQQGRRRTEIPRVINAQQNRLMVRFRYDSFGTLSESTAGAGAMATFRLNSLYDPDLTGTGKQPLGFDQYTAIFNRYRVLSCSWKITFLNALLNTEAGSRVQRVGFYTSSSNSVASDPEAWVAQLGAKSHLLGPSTGNMGVRTFRGKTDFSNVFGVRKVELTDLDYSATYNASPTRVAYLHCWTSALSAAGAIANYCTEFTFVAELSDRISLGLS